MLALLTALTLTVSTGGLASLDAVADGVVPDAAGDSSLAASTLESGAGDLYAQGDSPPMGDPLLEDPPMEDPPMEDPPPGDPPPDMPMSDPPEITDFSMTITMGGLLVVEGTVVDEDPPTCSVTINWLDINYTATPNGDGSFSWYVALEEGQTGYVSAVATDSDGQGSDKVEDYCFGL